MLVKSYLHFNLSYLDLLLPYLNFNYFAVVNISDICRGFTTC